MDAHGRSDGEWRPPMAGTALALAALSFAGALLWLRFGDGVYVERILGAIQNCF